MTSDAYRSCFAQLPRTCAFTVCVCMDTKCHEMITDHAFACIPRMYTKGVLCASYFNGSGFLYACNALFIKSTIILSCAPGNEVLLYYQTLLLAALVFLTTCLCESFF